MVSFYVFTYLFCDRHVVALQTDLFCIVIAAFSQCSQNVTIYKALNLEAKWNLIALTSTDAIETAIEKMKATHVTIPAVNFTNPSLTSILNNLDHLLSPSVLNFTHLIELISGPIIAPDLRQIRDGVANLNNANLADEVSFMLH